MADNKKATSYRLSLRALELVAALAKELGITHGAVIELALREMAERKGVKPKTTNKTKATK